MISDVKNPDYSREKYLDCNPAKDLKDFEYDPQKDTSLPENERENVNSLSCKFAAFSFVYMYNLLNL